MIEHFKILNDDGSTNQSEYERCISFLNNYLSGTIKVYPKLNWSNPFEVDMTQQKSARTILMDIINQPDNRLLTKQSFEDIKKLFKGLLDRYGSTIHTYGRYLEASKDFQDGPGYMYDVFNNDKDVKVLKEENSNLISTYYLDDENHTVLEYNDTDYAEKVAPTTYPVNNFPSLTIDQQHYKPNYLDYQDVYKGNLSGVYSDFQRLAGQYIGSSTLFYYSECNDKLYTTPGEAYEDERVNEIINFNYRATVGNKTRPARGIDKDRIKDLQTHVVDFDKVNGFIEPSLINTDVKYLNPTFFTSKDADDWRIKEETNGEESSENN